MNAVAEGDTGVVEAMPGEEKASLNTTRFQPEVRRTRRVVGKKPKKKKKVIVDLTMEFKSAEQIVNFDYDEKAPISAKVKKTLQKKVRDHNAKNPKHRATYRMLAAVFRRGVGAYRGNPSSVRGNVTGATQWGIARVNAFIKGLKGRFPRSAFDRDLLPSAHPLSSKKSADKETVKAVSVKVGDAVSWSIKKDPDPPSVVHGIVKSVNSNKKEATMRVLSLIHI